MLSLFFYFLSLFFFLSFRSDCIELDFFLSLTFLSFFSLSLTFLSFFSLSLFSLFFSFRSDCIELDFKEISYLVFFGKEIMFGVCYLPTLWHVAMKYPVLFWKASLLGDENARSLDLNEWLIKGTRQDIMKCSDVIIFILFFLNPLHWNIYTFIIILPPFIKHLASQ